MCEPKGILIPSVGEVAGGVVSGAVGVAMSAAPAVGALLAAAAVVSFILANAVLLAAGAAVVAIGTAAAVQYLKRYTVIRQESPARAQAAVPAGAVPLPRNLAITAPRRALPAPAQVVHLHFHGVPAEDIAAIVSRQGSPARPALEKE